GVTTHTPTSPGQSRRPSPPASRASWRWWRAVSASIWKLSFFATTALSSISGATMAAGTPVLPLAVPSELTLHVGERETIPLTSAGSVGYVWRMTVTGDAGTVEASTGPEHPRPPNAPRDGSLQQALFVLGLAPGHSTIRLELLRFGRPPPRESHEIAI